MEYDVVIIGAGISGLACAIELNKIARNKNVNYKICVLEKSAAIGGHILSGCLMNPRGMNALLPDWQNLLEFHPTPVQVEELVFLTQNKHTILSTKLSNQGNYVISLSQLVHKLGEYASMLGIDVLTQTAVTDFILNQRNQVIGVKTGAFGLNQDSGNNSQKSRLMQTANYQEGYEIYSQQLVLAEGCRGSLTKKIIAHFHLDRFSLPQTYALGIKEVWQTAATIAPGFVSHSLGYPLDNNTYGGGFLYTMDNNLVALGMVTGLDYQDSNLDPYLKFQAFKNHPYINKFLSQAQCLEYGAKTITEGGVQSLPRLSFPGGLLIGESAGFVNTATLKGSHLAIESGMMAAQAIFTQNQPEVKVYKKMIKKHRLYKELYQVRNIRPAFNKGLIIGGIYYLFEKYILRFHSFWTLRNNVPDYKKTNMSDLKYIPAVTMPNHYPNKEQSLVLSHITHRPEQPSHLLIGNLQLIYEVNQKLYNNPETRYCPAGVYKMYNDQLIIKSQNCLHCKACDIKDPMQNINWTPPEGGNGPNYSWM